MKQVQLKRGEVVVEDVPAPRVEPGAVLVRVWNSCVSAGTEMSGLRASALPLWKRAIRQPGQVYQVLEMAWNQGVAHTKAVIDGALSAGNATGYSAAGVVLEVGEGIDDLVVGDRVACAGAQCAHHAEIIRVPRNLTALVPDGLNLAAASTATLGAIALQGVRRATPTLGETFVVLGLGLLGQLTVQILKANGCRVIGTDLDRSRVDLALSLGMDSALLPEQGSDLEQAARLTQGLGADGVIITASSPSDSLVSTAFQVCRRKGRVVLVGDVGLNLNRADFYAKEIDFLISTSYGPGRYDRNYEEDGLDYPAAYVRWTENRNLTEYLQLLARKSVRVEPLIQASFPVERAAEAFAALGSGKKPLIVVLDYPRDAVIERVVVNPQAASGGGGRVRLGIIGAGTFLKGMHLPNLRSLGNLFSIEAVASRTGHNAQATAKLVGARFSTTDFEAILNDAGIDAVLIATRHDQHAAMSLAALRAGKHVLVEKPLALAPEELAPLVAFFQERAGQTTPILLTGFNRRFSPHAGLLRSMAASRTHPLVATYRMNAGYLPAEHWALSREGGGRNLGEACHIYDLFTYLTDARVVNVTAAKLQPKGYYSPRDNFVATITFDDGSLASLTYTSLGHRDHPKEQMEVFFDGKTMTLDDYHSSRVVGVKNAAKRTRTAEKGHREELEAFAQGIREGRWPIPWWQQVQATEIAIAVERYLGPSTAAPPEVS